ncbi:SRPBCC family protein [Nonomuraea antimicrobica]|uniref:SRPBCC family protein n=1 Tax=Nonomuraea antimicrobica TaxID=561173 RepID=A0ABP7BGZ2_9ACTN
MANFESSIVEAQLDAVERSLTATPDEDVVVSAVTLSQSYPVDPKSLWAACTTQERLAQWLGPVSGDLRVEGRYQLEDTAAGVVRRCHAPKSFVVSWDYGDDTSLVEVRLRAEEAEDAEAEGGTRLTVIHSADIASQRWAQYGAGESGIGWDIWLLCLAHHLATGDAVATAVNAWTESVGGRRFIAESSRRWADKSVATGTPEADARAAQARITAFYANLDPAGQP